MVMLLIVCLSIRIVYISLGYVSENHAFIICYAIILNPCASTSNHWKHIVLYVCRFVEIYSHQTVSFGKVQKPISCCIVDKGSSAEPSKASSSQATPQPMLKHQKLVAAS